MRGPLELLGLRPAAGKKSALTDAELVQLREWHRERMDRRALGQPDRRRQPRLPVDGRPEEGRAFAYFGRRSTDRPDD
jgi:hypothetical protein